MKLFKVFLLYLAFTTAFVPPSRAMDVIDLYQGMQTWSMRFGGYRNYRIPVKLVSGKTCVVALTAHVNPRSEGYTLLIHGFGDSRFSWWKWIELYRDHPQYTSFIAIDLPLHGDSNCDSVEEWDTIVEVLDRALKTFGRKPLTRIVGQSLGVVPTALLADRYPAAQQVWLTPPLLKPEPLKILVKELLDLTTPLQVQSFMNRVLTEDREFPEFIRKEILSRIEKSQRILRRSALKTLDARVLRRKYENLLVITGAKDELVPPDELDPRVSSLSSRTIEAVPCGHDVLRGCGEDVKNLVEQSRYRIDKARY